MRRHLSTTAWQYIEVCGQLGGRLAPGHQVACTMAMMSEDQTNTGKVSSGDGGVGNNLIYKMV